MHRAADGSHGRRLLLIFGSYAAVALFCVPVRAQDPVPPSSGAIIGEAAEPAAAPVSDPEAEPSIRTARGKWNNFVAETVSPLTLGAGTFNAFFSQETQTDPQYGRGGVAFAKRWSASVGDIVSQNFFGDFAVASAFHEDPRYHRMGEGHSMFRRFAYAVTRAVVIRKDSGGNTFNFDNVLGSAMSTGFSNLYYPSPSRTRNAMLIHFGTDIADNGFVNLAPEFWPDFRRKVLRRRH